MVHLWGGMARGMRRDCAAETVKVLPRGGAVEQCRAIL
jgi:hypothetical protein